jgi:hypothetical protein
LQQLVVVVVVVVAARDGYSNNLGYFLDVYLNGKRTQCAPIHKIPTESISKQFQSGEIP